MSETKERPILMSGPMVRAILAGTKTQTRRVIRFPKHTADPNGSLNWIESIHQDGGGNWIAWSTDTPGLAEFTKRAYPTGEGFPCPFGQPGDRLWVREAWGISARIPMGFQRQMIQDGIVIDGDFAYRADNPPGNWCWRPSIHMPRWASRIVLEVTSVRVERVQDITPEDACAEGVPSCREHLSNVHAVEWFRQLWDSVNAGRGYGWDSNPWVWVVGFRKLP